MGEDESYSYYEAFLVDAYRGENREKFILKQEGTSESTRIFYPLFISGNELLVFLRKSAQSSEYNNLYEMINGPGSVFYAVNDDAGNIYYYDRFRILEQVADANMIENIPVDSFMRELYDKLVKEKAIFEDEWSEGVHYFYREEDFAELLGKEIPYYQIDSVDDWEFEVLSEETTVVKKGGEEIGRIDVYPQCNFALSASSIVANIYGMHAFLVEEFQVPMGVPDLRYCLVVDYELTAAGKEVGTKELHYIYVAEDGTMVDFFIEYVVPDEEILEIVRSIRLCR